MPIIKSAKKRVVQSRKAYERNKHYGTKMRTMVKNVLKETNAEKAEKMLPETYSSIDMALKRNLLHRNNAAHQKAKVSKAVANLKEGKPAVEVQKAKAKTAVAKKTAPKTVKKTTTTKKTEEKK